MSRGFVYILSNPSMPGLVKIGKTIRSVEGRANELYQTGVPTPFKVEHSLAAPDCGELERLVHERLAEFRVSGGREFFKTSAEHALEIVDELRRTQVEEWLACFFPDHTIVESEAFIDPSTVSILANRAALGLHEMDFVLEYIRPEDIAYAKRKYLERRAFIAASKSVPAGVLQ